MTRTIAATDRSDAVSPRIEHSRWSSDDGIRASGVPVPENLEIFDGPAQAQWPGSEELYLTSERIYLSSKKTYFSSEETYFSSEKTSGPNLCPFRSPSSTSAILPDRNELCASSSTWSWVTLSISRASSSSG